MEAMQPQTQPIAKAGRLLTAAQLDRFSRDSNNQAVASTVLLLARMHSVNSLRTRADIRELAHTLSADTFLRLVQITATPIGWALAENHDKAEITPAQMQDIMKRKGGALDLTDATAGVYGLWYCFEGAVMRYIGSACSDASRSYNKQEATRWLQDFGVAHVDNGSRLPTFDPKALAGLVGRVIQHVDPVYRRSKMGTCFHYKATSSFAADTAARGPENRLHITVLWRLPGMPALARLVSRHLWAALVCMVESFWILRLSSALDGLSDACLSAVDFRLARSPDTIPRMRLQKGIALDYCARYSAREMAMDALCGSYVVRLRAHTTGPRPYLYLETAALGNNPVLRVPAKRIVLPQALRNKTLRLGDLHLLWGRLAILLGKINRRQSTSFLSPPLPADLPDLAVCFTFDARLNSSEKQAFKGLTVWFGDASEGQESVKDAVANARAIAALAWGAWYDNDHQNRR